MPSSFFLIGSILISGIFMAGSLSSCGSGNRSNHQAGLESTKPVYVRVPTAMLSRKWVETTGFNRDHAKDAFFALGWISPKNLAALPHEDKASITILNEKDVSRGLLNPITLQTSSFIEDASKEDYHNYQAMTAELKSLTDTYSDLAQLESAGKSIQGRDLWLVRISSDIATQSKKPKLIYIANMHGDEVVGRELSIYYIRRLLKDYGTDTRITNLLNHAELFIIPSMNPDGFEKHQRFNSNNVDLNRDFPDFTSDTVDTTAGRAIETAAIMALHAKHHFVTAINFHGGEVCFNLPWDTKPNNAGQTFGDDHILNPMGHTWASSNPTMYANNSGTFDHGLTYGYEWYEVDGGMQDWSIFYRQSMHATVELSYTKWPSTSQLPKAWDENKEAMLAFQERSIEGIHVEAVTTSGEPVRGIRIKVKTSGRDVNFTENFATRTTSSGAQEVTVEANGFRPTVVNLVARSFDGHYDQVVLTP
ncbi:MAG: DUF2817 domain-containing protein [Proteobacteria bacterium]|nr:DUF2817 domain-containing protein [Pseudomonadota bacterium]